MIKIGDRVRIVGGDLYLGKWLMAGTELIVSMLGEDGCVHVVVGGKQYTLAPANFEVICTQGETVVIEDDGEID